MKKILAIVLAAVMLLSMTACGAAAKKDTYVVGWFSTTPSTPRPRAFRTL